MRVYAGVRTCMRGYLNVSVGMCTRMYQKMERLHVWVRVREPRCLCERVRVGVFDL